MWSSRLRSRSQKCSHYVPVVGPDSPSSSSSSSRDNSRNTRDKKAKNDAAGSKRRSTMNSRDAAYDEEEQLRRAIEESKEESKSVLGDTGNRRPKRTRSDDEVYVHSKYRCFCALKCLTINCLQQEQTSYKATAHRNSCVFSLKAEQLTSSF